ncbi:DUF4085 family protein [Fusibacter bizertensis]|uniref:DUF4085 family protein n=1 Tax=Fusibacter bizertensis TaxID=1488331 RepID=A0ABT6NAV7_9FIRM|nr:DUF4085 family protein [Fusibacter bizertensis]MDH8677541.1 DUF4085 family protein [Fusibacter bizertensis]
MKYYKKYLWLQMHSPDEKLRQEAKTKFRESAKEYGPYFEKIKSQLPEQFLEVFNDMKWFHDFSISSICVNNIAKSTTVKLTIEDDENRFVLKLSDVATISMDIPNKNYWMPSGMKWGYTEFELFEDKWSINILCDINCELEFRFKSISCERFVSK